MHTYPWICKHICSGNQVLDQVVFLLVGVNTGHENITDSCDWHKFLQPLSLPGCSCTSMVLVGSIFFHLLDTVRGMYDCNAPQLIVNMQLRELFTPTCNGIGLGGACSGWAT